MMTDAMTTDGLRDADPDIGLTRDLPLLVVGTEMPARARDTSSNRAAMVVQVITSEHHLHLLADGQRIEPACLADQRFAFMLPAGCDRILLRSRRFVPAHANPDSSDTRVLGVCVHRLQIDGADIALDDDATLGAGWHDPEPCAAGGLQRWTQGEVRLPPGTRLVMIELYGVGQYWQDDANLVSMFG